MPSHPRFLRLLPALTMTIVLALAAAFMTVPRADAATDMDCTDFDTQAAAQAFFDDAGPGDPHLLDGDADGLACESLPCPCSYEIQPIAAPATTPWHRHT